MHSITKLSVNMYQIVRGILLNLWMKNQANSEAKRGSKPALEKWPVNVDACLNFKLCSGSIKLIKYFNNFR